MSDGVEDTDAALRAIDAGQIWVTNADTKIGLATAALALLTSAFASRAGAVADVLATDPIAGWTLVAGAAVVAVLLSAAGGKLVKGLLPATTSPRPNRFAWPSIKDLTDDQIAEGCEPEDLRIQAWEQARCLATIAHRKYTCFDAGAKRLAVSFLALVIWIVAGLVLSAPEATPSPQPIPQSTAPNIHTTLPPRA